MSLYFPDEITNNEYRFDSFNNGKVLLSKKKNHLPAMGWNSWNAFGSGNTENLTKAMAEAIIDLGLDKLGYKFIVLDDGCYKSCRIDGKLSNDEVKFPNGFKALGDFIHSKGLKFGMYNDIGTNLCAGAAVGTCGHEIQDGASYVEWGVDFLKIDNCYYLWDNATFSDSKNAKYVYTPKIQGIKIVGENFEKSLLINSEVISNITSVPHFNTDEIIVSGKGVKVSDNWVWNIGTFDGTNTGTSPVGDQSGELHFITSVPHSGIFTLKLIYESGEEVGCGKWVQIGIKNQSADIIQFDNFIEDEIKVFLEEGENIIRVMNHRRQENTLCSYATMLDALNKANPNHDIILSICEWGKTQPQNWGYKIGDSWRILNDITFRVGSDGDAGFGEWRDRGTPSVTSQYNKAVIMDEFAGLQKGWNDPDMLMIGMKGLSLPMCKTHFTMWCMMNSPLMLGLDLRNIKKGDDIYNIIANSDIIALNQDSLGIQAKRIWTSIDSENPDKDYIEDTERADILIKPLSDGNFALSLFNLSENNSSKQITISMELIQNKFGHLLSQDFTFCKKLKIFDLWSKKIYYEQSLISIPSVKPCENFTIKVSPVL